MDEENGKLSDWLVVTRREFHMHPELSTEEKETAARIKKILRSLNVEAYDLQGFTGVVGLIQGKAPGKTIALRADMDALPVQELNEVPYKSQNNGIMHACGHDIHTTIMLGVAKAIQESGIAMNVKGNVKLLFQPAEEKGIGAREMIARGVLENPTVDEIFACHVSPELPVGTIGINPAQSHASADWFSLCIKGKGAHGAHPSDGIDPIVAGASLITALQSIVSLNIPPTETAVITVGRFTAGSAANVIPEEANLEGTIRTFRTDIRDQIIERLREMIRGIEKAFRVSCSLEIKEGMPACVNDRHVAEFLYDVASAVLGSENVSYIPPSTGSEDFALFAMEKPSALIRLGSGNKEKGLIHPLHSPLFDVDEEVLMVGVRVFVEAIRRALA
ncbi:MAG: M20 metallopeptidase family protein [Thermodesulfobacteriota bacterium]